MYVYMYVCVYASTITLSMAPFKHLTKALHTWLSTCIKSKQVCFKTWSVSNLQEFSPLYYSHLTWLNAMIGERLKPLVIHHHGNAATQFYGHLRPESESGHCI